MSDLWNEFMESLREADVKVTINPARIVSSSIHDVDYQLCLAALAFGVLATTREQYRDLWARQLQLGCFIASRPDLLPYVDRAIRFKEPLQLPRGFATNRVHTAVMDYVVALGICERVDDSFRVATESPLWTLATRLNSDGLFVRERETLERFGKLRITKKAIGEA